MTSFNVAIAQWRLGRLRSTELPEIATAALERGLDSPALRQLAGLPNTADYDAVELLQRAAAELGTPIPDARGAVLTIARSIAERIVNATLEPYEGARQIWGLWVDDFPDELLVFVGSASLMEDYRVERLTDPATYDPFIAACEDDIRQAARALAGSVAV